MTDGQKSQTLEEVGEFLVQSILDHVGSAKSPVEGGAYAKKLSKNYAKLKAEISGSGVANMELYGDMLDALEYRIDPDRGTVEVGYFDPDQVPKADNHNKFSPESKKTSLPYRQHIPRSNERFNEKKIMQEVYRIVKNASED